MDEPVDQPEVEPITEPPAPRDPRETKTHDKDGIPWCWYPRFAWLPPK